MASVDIETRNIGLNFDREDILKSVNFSLNKGEKFALLGPSGRGKSCFIKILAGVLAPSEGQVLIQGQNLYEASKSEQQTILKKMGMLFQKNALFDSMTCAENISFPLREASDMGAAEINEKVEFFLDAVGIRPAAKLFPSEISGGMQKRLGIARALALDPEIIFFDDPTAGLDPITSRKIMDLILEQQSRKNSTMIVVTSDVRRAFQVADRIGILFDKDILITGDVQSTKNHSDPQVLKFIGARRD